MTIVAQVNVARWQNQDLNTINFTSDNSSRRQEGKLIIPWTYSLTVLSRLRFFTFWRREKGREREREREEKRTVLK